MRRIGDDKHAYMYHVPNKHGAYLVEHVRIQ